MTRLLIGLRSGAWLTLKFTDDAYSDHNLARLTGG